MASIAPEAHAYDWHQKGVNIMDTKTLTRKTFTKEKLTIAGLITSLSLILGTIFFGLHQAFQTFSVVGSL